jgi:Domain of unknown function (DUF4292)
MPCRRAALAVLAAALAACAPRVPPPDLSLEPAQLLAQVRAGATAAPRVQGEARLRLDAPGASGSMPAWLAAERPDRLHVEVLDFFGNPAATLVAANGRLAISDARTRTFLRGAATPANVARLLPLPLSPERLVAILCGTPPLDGEPVAAGPGRGYATLTLRDGPRTTDLRVGPRAAILRAEVRGGAPALPDHVVVYGAFEELPRVRFPTEVIVTSPDPAVRVELAWKDPEVGASVDPSLFRLEAPAGARVVDLDLEPELPAPLPLPLAP